MLRICVDPFGMQCCGSVYQMMKKLKKKYLEGIVSGVMLLENIARQWGRGRFKNTYELLNLRTLKISTLYKNHIFQSMGNIFCVEFEIPHKISYPYVERCAFYLEVKI